MSPLKELDLYRPDLKHFYQLYLDYLVYSLVEPGFEEKLPEKDRDMYLRAIRKIEGEELASWRCACHNYCWPPCETCSNMDIMRQYGSTKSRQAM